MDCKREINYYQFNIEIYLSSFIIRYKVRKEYWKGDLSHSIIYVVNVNLILF